MSTQNIIIAVIIIIIGILLLKTISKVIFKILTVIILLGALAYILLFFQGGVLGIGNKDFILYELREKACMGDAKEQVKCRCIIEPLIAEFESQYTTLEIQELQKDKAKSIKEIIRIANLNKESINNCLKEGNNESLWLEFFKDLKRINIGQKSE